MKKRLPALFLCLALLLSLSACFRIVPKTPTTSPTETTPAETTPAPEEEAPSLPVSEPVEEPAEPAAGPDDGEPAQGPEEDADPADEPEEPAPAAHFQEVWHGDVDFAELRYTHYEAADFDALTEPLYRIARSGGSAEDFDAADSAVVEALYEYHTMQTLMELAFSADPSDDVYYEEYAYCQDLFNAAWDEYCLAMYTLAVSPHGDVMEDYYGQEGRAYFASWEDDDGAGTALLSEVNALRQDYAREMAKSSPDYDAIGELYVKLVAKNKEYARSQGYDSYADYAYEQVFYRDYGPADSEAVWAGVKEYIVPLMEEYGYEAWLSADRMSRARGLDCSEEAILEAMSRALPDFSPELDAAFRYMLEHGLCDLSCDPRKENTGFTTLLYSVNEPFIFNAPYGSFYDYSDTFHEFGHFANFFYTESDLLFGMSDYDLSELQSQGMELMFTHYYEDIFGSRADMAQQALLMNMIYTIVDGALYDEFQQRVYAEEELTPEKADAIFAELYEEYGYAPYDGYEREWMGVTHNFDYPFYYISYGVSALGALELWTRAQTDWDGAVDLYLTACAMDTEAYYFSEAIEELGMSDVFEEEAYRSVAAALKDFFQ